MHIQPKVPGLSTPFSSVRAGLRRSSPPPEPRMPQPRRLAAAGRGKGHFGAEWEPSRGDVSARTLAATFPLLPPHPSRPPPPLQWFNPHSAPHMGPSRKITRTPDLGERPPASRPQTKHGGGGGRARRWVATAVSGLFGRGQRLWSEKMGGGRERQTLQTRRGRAELLQPPGRVCQAE